MVPLTTMFVSTTLLMLSNPSDTTSLITLFALPCIWVACCIVSRKCSAQRCSQKENGIGKRKCLNKQQLQNRKIRNIVSKYKIVIEQSTPTQFESITVHMTVLQKQDLS